MDFLHERDDRNELVEAYSYICGDSESTRDSLESQIPCLMSFYSWRRLIAHNVWKFIVNMGGKAEDCNFRAIVQSKTFASICADWIQSVLSMSYWLYTINYLPCYISSHEMHRFKRATRTEVWCSVRRQNF